MKKKKKQNFMHGRRFNGKWKNFKQEIFLYEKNISFFLETLITHNNKEVLKFLLKIQMLLF